MVSVLEAKSDLKQPDNGTESKTFKSMNFKEKILYVKEVISIEPLICCIVFAKMISGPAIGNLHLEKACRVNAGFNDTICDAVLSGTYLEMGFKEQNNEVQLYLTHVSSWQVPISSIVPVILVLTLASYSDRHKIRKPFLLMPIFGDVIHFLGTLLNVFYLREWPLEAQVVADSIIPSFFGAEKLIIMVSYAYIADISTPEMRTIRLAVIPIVLNVCIPIAQAISGVLLQNCGYITILSISLFLTVNALFYGIIRIKEPRQEVKTENKIKDLFRIQNIGDTLRLIYKYKGTQRTTFLLILVLCYIHSTVNTGEHSIFFLFTQATYQWTVVDFTYFKTTATIIHLIGLTVGIPLFTKVFRFRDATIIILAYADTILASIIYVIVSSPIGLYIAVTVSMFKSVGHAATRSQLTKAISEEDTAKAFSLNTIVGAAAAAIAAQIYIKGIYENTRTTFPQAFLLLGIGLHFIGILILLWIFYQEKKTEKNEEPENENDLAKDKETQTKTSELEVYTIEKGTVDLPKMDATHKM